jgi:hypothetical protein
MPPTTGSIKIEQGGAKNITINHGSGGGDCGRRRSWPLPPPIGPPRPFRSRARVDRAMGDALEGEGRREHGKGRRDGYTTARDGAALRRWTAQRHDGQGTARRPHDGEGRRSTTAMDGMTARRLHDGEGWRGATAMDGATARRLHDGEGRHGTTAMGCGDGSSKAREGASAAKDGATATRRQGTRQESDLSSF